MGTLPSGADVKFCFTGDLVSIRSRMGEEENELEGGVYGGDNFVNNVSAFKI